jgi:ribonuclease J
MKNRNDYLLLVTGHQGEATSVLSKMLKGEYAFKFEKNDSVLLCANAIPSPINIASRYIVETKLKSFNVRIFDDLHVSGHAAKEDHRRILDMIKPEHIIPCHGGIRMRGEYAALATEEGYDLSKNVHLLTNGSSIEI